MPTMLLKGDIMELLFVIIFGLLIGSFLNVCIYRIPRNESISYPPSHCGSCGKNIKGYDLIPVISYTLLKGKCRYCKEKISIRYPAIEVLTAVLFSAVYIKYGLSFELLKYINLTALLIVISMIDLETTDVYFKTILFGIITGIIFIGFGYYLSEINVMNYLVAGLIGGLVIALIIVITKGMGWGDAEICLVCGLYLGLRHTVVMLLFAFIFGAVIGMALIVLKKKSRKDYIPFGPFIAAAAIFSILFGENVIFWYLG
jgi:leader peptidase (prepilin peptidase) / N-methyltransferase